jgi:hypothetical protein
VLPTVLAAALAATTVASPGPTALDERLAVRGETQLVPGLPSPRETGLERGLVPGPPSPRETGLERGLHQEHWEEQQWGDEQPDQEEGPRKHVMLSVWGGEALANGGTGRSSGVFAAEVAWVFSSVDLGLQGARYRSLREGNQLWTPVVMTRLTQRFMTGHGIEAAFTLGFGAGKPSGWIAWYQAALGMRVPLGPVFLGGELAFEQYSIIRLTGGLGLAF